MQHRNAQREYEKVLQPMVVAGATGSPPRAGRPASAGARTSPHKRRTVHDAGTNPQNQGAQGLYRVVSREEDAWRRLASLCFIGPPPVLGLRRAHAREKQGGNLGV